MLGVETELRTAQSILLEQAQNKLNLCCPCLCLTPARTVAPVVPGSLGPVQEREASGLRSGTALGTSAGGGAPVGCPPHSGSPKVHVS